jgi:phosphate uptake regulator
MNESQHLSSQFDEELSRLRTHVLQMGGLVETQVSAAIEAYHSARWPASRPSSNRPQGQ